MEMNQKAQSKFIYSRRRKQSSVGTLENTGAIIGK
jgi:hypothetical protein